MLAGLLALLASIAPVILNRGDVELELAVPGTYYQGTRFDWSGVFRNVKYRGESFCDEWFEASDPLRHDHVCGPSEEFSGAVGYNEAPAGGQFLKAGVGMLVKADDGPYDEMKTYEIADGGKRRLRRCRARAVFTHTMKNRYRYKKTVVIRRGGTFELLHRMKNTGKDTLRLRQYSHNFFTFDLDRVGPERSVEFHAPVSGDWREDNVHGRMTASGILMEGTMEKGQKSYIGNLKVSYPPGEGYSFILKAGKKAVLVRSDRPMGESVFWSNHRVFCPEPYIDLVIAPGEAVSWRVSYTLVNF